MDEASMQFFKQVPNIKNSVWTLWNQLLPIYKYFQDNKQLPNIIVNTKGEYIISNLEKPSNG